MTWLEIVSPCVASAFGGQTWPGKSHVKAGIGEYIFRHKLTTEST
jgi:hypothetical protein